MRFRAVSFFLRDRDRTSRGAWACGRDQTSATLCHSRESTFSRDSRVHVQRPVYAFPMDSSMRTRPGQTRSSPFSCRRGPNRKRSPVTAFMVMRYVQSYGISFALCVLRRDVRIKNFWIDSIKFPNRIIEFLIIDITVIRFTFNTRMLKINIDYI